MDQNRFKELIQPNIDLMLKKHQDYGSNQGGDTPLEDYFPFGDKSYIQMLHVKTLRLVSLTNGNRDPNHEKVADTVRDLINYAVFYLDYLDEENRLE
jgi:hypothetical protein